jgi:hypothetical protein
VVIDDDNVIAMLYQRDTGMAADEAATAGDENCFGPVHSDTS